MQSWTPALIGLLVGTMPTYVTVPNNIYAFFKIDHTVRCTPQEHGASIICLTITCYTSRTQDMTDKGMWEPNEIAMVKEVFW